MTAVATLPTSGWTDGCSSDPKPGERPPSSLALGPLASAALAVLTNSDREMGAREIQRAMGCSSPSLSNALHSLSIRGLVTKLERGLWVAGCEPDDVALLPACRGCSLKYHELTEGYCPMCVSEGVAA